MKEDLLSATALTAFVIAATREVRKRWPAVDGLFVWLAAGLIGIAASFTAAALLGPVEWRAAVIRGLAFAVAAVGAVGTKKALVETAPKPLPPAPDSAASTLQGVAVPTPETHGARAPELDFDDARPSNR